MTPQKKVKFLIGLAILIVIILFSVVVFQIIQINKTKTEIANQEKQIEQLQQELDYHKNKQPSSDYEEIN